MSELPIAFRPANSDDYGFILKTMTVELQKTSPYQYCPPTIFVPAQRNLINSLLASMGAIVCHLEDAPDQLVGYLIAEPVNQENLILHWGHVKAIYRRLGIFKELLTQFDQDYKNKNIVCSHYFNLYPKLKDRYHLVFDPFTLGKYNV